MYVLKLYIAGHTVRSERAVLNLRQLCDNELESGYELEIVDLLERPQRAEDERIFATPTLIREAPLPVRRVIGDLSDLAAVRRGLDLGGADRETSREGEQS